MKLSELNCSFGDYLEFLQSDGSIAAGYFNAYENAYDNDGGVETIDLLSLDGIPCQYELDDLELITK